MFCPKCGNQLPDGAAFCSSCGSPINVQPIAPIEPVVTAEPVAPVEPVVTAEPIAPVQEDIPGEPVMFEMPEQTNSNGQFVPQTQAPIMNQMNAMDKPKKSKAPLFIILGVSVTLIAIVAIVLILLFDGKDNNDNDAPANGTESQTTTLEQESSTEEETTTDSSSSDINYGDAEDLATDLMDALYEGDAATAAKYTLPSMAESLEGTEFDIEAYINILIYSFLDSDLAFLDYSVKSAKEYDGDSFYDTYESDLKDMDSYVEPTAFASVEVELSYQDQTSSVYLEFAYCDDQFYFYNIDDSEFDIVFEEETSTEAVGGSDDDSTIDVSNSLATNIKTILGDATGTRISYDGYSIVVPDNWTDESDDSLTYLVSSDQITNINVVSDTALALYGAEAYFEALMDSFESMGLENIEIGTLNANDQTGYYTEYDYSVTDTITYHGVQFIYVKDDIAYCVTVTTGDASSDTYDDGLYAAASFLFE